jgi:hypothetical protein
VFLLPSVLVGIVLSLLLGGSPLRLGDLRFGRSWTVLVALGVQIWLFSRFGASLPAHAIDALHLGTYVLLFVFAWSNRRVRALFPMLIGMALNALVIAVNGGRMPLAHAAASVLGSTPSASTNVSEHAARLWFLGDVFALPREVPFANVFSFGDLLIGAGAIALIVTVSTQESTRPALSPRRLVAPLRKRPYRHVAAGKLISQVGDWLTLTALIGWVYHETNSTAEAALVMLVRLAPPLLGGSFAAMLVARLPTRRLLPALELARGAIVASAVLAVVVGSRAGAIAALACSGVFATIGNAAVPALLPALVADDELPAANAGIGMTKSVAMAFGAGCGGLALATVGVAASLALDLATFVIAFALFVTADLRVDARPAAPGEPAARGFVRYVLGRPRLLVLVGAFSAATLATGLTNASLPRFLDKGLGLGPSAYGYGIAALALGLTLGEILVGFAPVGPAAARWVGVGLAVMSSLFLLLAFTRHAPTALLVLCAIGFVDGTTDVLYDTIMQREAEPRYLGAAFGFSTTAITATMIAGVIAAPLANRLASPRTVIGAAAGFVLLAGVIALVGMRSAPRTRLEPAPSTGGS